MEEKHRSVKNLRADTSKPGSQKAVSVNAWLLAQGSYKRPKPLLIKAGLAGLIIQRLLMCFVNLIKEVNNSAPNQKLTTKLRV